MSKKHNWVWSKKTADKISIGDKWTLLAVECEAQVNCERCSYWIYCKKNKINDIPIMKHVVDKLYVVFGNPPQELIDKFNEYSYNGDTTNS